MSLAEDSGAIDRMTRTLQIIVFALTMGPVIFLGIVLFLPMTPKRPAAAAAPAPAGVPAQLPPAAQSPVLPVLTVAAFTMVVILVPLSLVVPRLTVDAARKQIAAGKWSDDKRPPGVPPPTTDAERLAIVRLAADRARKQIKQIAAGKWSPDKLPAGMSPPATDAERLAFVYSTQKIMGAAMNEGCAFFALIAYMIEGNAIALGLALLLIAGVALRFPRRDQVAAWIDDQLGRLDSDRQVV
jgi:hypothetical protein